MSRVLMKCGHVALGTDKDGKPVCPICIGLRPESRQEDDVRLKALHGRVARCVYCGTGTLSSSLPPFFGHTPTEKEDTYYCGCRGWD